MSGREGTTESGGTRKLSLRILLLLIFAVALSPVLVIGGLRWSSDIERETQRRREMMSLVAEEAADRAESVLTAAPALLNVIDTLLASDPCSKHINQLIDQLPQYSALGVIDGSGRVLCTTMDGGEQASVADRPWFQELKSTNAGFIQSSAYLGPVSKQWILASAKRRTDAAGAFAGAFVLGVPVDSLVYRLDRTGLPEGSEMAIL
ncbi:MAG TPA: cache domain-containing protein, partial [Hyphomonadaceae bacterium]|nr:cache domain-containing protein [Hyphomonadaceae bacterium]